MLQTNIKAELNNYMIVCLRILDISWYWGWVNSTYRCWSWFRSKSAESLIFDFIRISSASPCSGQWARWALSCWLLLAPPHSAGCRRCFRGGPCCTPARTPWSYGPRPSVSASTPLGSYHIWDWWGCRPSRCYWPSSFSPPALAPSYAGV